MRMYGGWAGIFVWIVYVLGAVSAGWASVSDVDGSTQEAHGQTAVEPDDPGYNWRGLLWQSLEFNVIENGFRLASDHHMRDQLAHKPFWRDYANSLSNFHMNRWNDGDSILVNYGGHGMQGAIAAYLEIQNSPRDARIRWGEPGYGWSRFRGFLWSTAFSTHSEISPIGEAGIGNEGGFTYGVKCLDECSPRNFTPGVSQYTNNTGWVDFVVTPVAGTVIVMAEDFVDKKISDPLSERLVNHPLAAKILRGSFTPARSWTNMLRGKVPWYRDYESGWPQANAGVHFVKSDEEIAAQRRQTRFAVSPHLSGFSLVTNTLHCSGCRNLVSGAGVELTARLLPWLDADSDVSYQPGASPLPSDRAGGNMLSAFFGVRTGIQTRNYGVHIALRPGLIRYDRAFTSSPTTTTIHPLYPGTTVNAGIGPTVVNPTPVVGPITHFAWNVNLSSDYRITPHFSLRASLSENLIRYRTSFVDPPGPGAPPYESYLSPQNFTNRGNWSYQTGPVFSF